jgi:tetratricopeptide (TPR) repeat protein
MHKLVADTLRVQGIISSRQSEFTKARSTFEESLRISREIGDQLGESRTLNNLGNIANIQGDFEYARLNFENALTTFRELGDRNAESIILINLGLLLFNLRDIQRAREHYEEALDLVIEMENRMGEGNVLLNLGALSSVEGDYSRACLYHEKALSIFREIGDRSAECVVMSNLGEVALDQGDFTESHRLLDKALEQSRKFGESFAECLALLNLVLRALYLGNLDEAQDFCEEAIEVIQKNELADFKGSAYVYMGSVLEERNRLEEAADHYQQALKIAKDLGKEYLAVYPLAGLASVKLTQQDIEQALPYVEEIMAFLDKHTLHADKDIHTYLICYRVLNSANDPKGDEFLRTAYRLLQERAQKIDDEGLRRSFLEKIPHNRNVVSAYEEQFG